MRAIFKDTEYPSNDGSGWSNQECEKIITILHDIGMDSKELDLVTEGRVYIGMPNTAVWYA